MCRCVPLLHQPVTPHKFIARLALLPEVVRLRAGIVSPQMPLCDGLQATREIREHERALASAAEGGRRPLRIIGLTANASEEDRRVENFMGTTSFARCDDCAGTLSPTDCLLMTQSVVMCFLTSSGTTVS